MAVISLGSAIAALLWGFAAKQGADVVAKGAGHEGIWEWLGVEPSSADLKKLAKEQRKAEGEEFSRGVRQQHIDELMSFARSPNQSSVDSAVLSSAFRAMQRGSSIENIIPVGMQPTKLLQQMQANEAEAWRKVRDARPAETPLVNAANQGAAARQQPGPLAQVMQGGGAPQGAAQPQGAR